jgi:hypothetical protein
MCGARLPTLAFGCLLAPLAMALASGTAWAQTIDLAASRVVDLTHEFDKETLYWPTAPSGFELKPVHRDPTPLGFYYAVYSF